MRPGLLRERLVVVGNGMAGLRFLEELVRRAPGRFEVTVVGAEPEPAYNRVLLSSLLAGDIGAGDVAAAAARLVRRARHCAGDRAGGVCARCGGAHGDARRWRGAAASTGWCWRRAPMRSACRCRAGSWRAS